jgi:DNA polymerase-3 subunit delta'
MIMFAFPILLSPLGLYIWYKEKFYFQNETFTYVKPFSKSQSAAVSQISRVEISTSGLIRVTFIGKNGEKLLVSDSNEIVAEVYTKPVNMQNKIFVINNFDISTQEAQNKLLKVLEEPPKNVYFLISAQSEEKVLPTIRSRCDKIKINPMSQAEMATISTDKIACVLGGGYVGKTLQLEKNDSLRRLTEFVVSLFTRLKSSKQVIKFSKTMIEEKDNLDLILEIACLCIEDMLKLKCESENLCKLTTFTQELQDAEPEFSVEALCEISKLVSNLREKLEFNANLTVAIDNFLLKMLEVKYLCK